MKSIHNTFESAKAKLEEIGFTYDSENDRFYFAADENQKSYLTLTFDTNWTAAFVDSTGTSYNFADVTSSSTRVLLYIDYYELYGGGLALRLYNAATNDSSIPGAITLAIVAKEDGSGFVYLNDTAGAANTNHSNIYDDGNGVVTTLKLVKGTLTSNDSRISQLVKIYDQSTDFIHAHVRWEMYGLYAYRNSLYKFTIENESYINGMAISNANANNTGGIVFRLP